MIHGEFLDFLPEDVHQRIATFVRSNSYYDALEFAKRSEKQRLAMIAALNFKLVLSDAFQDDIADWIAIFGDSVRRLDCTNLTKYDIPETSAGLPNLSSAQVFARSSHFRTIKNSPELRNLRIVLHFEVDWEALIEMCSLLPLKEICLECDWKSPCSFSRLCSDNNLFRLASSCPNVTKLDMNCSCEDTPNLWPLVSSFKSLTHLALHKEIDSEAIEFLKTLKEVDFHENMPIRRLVPLGRVVTTVTQFRRASMTTVALLESFPRLKVLRLSMLNGAERALPGVVESIEGLDISWCYDDFFDEEPDVGYGDGEVDFDKGTTEYYPVDPCVLERIISNAQHLRELYLRKAVVKVNLVEKVIERVGKRLEKLAVHMDQQGEHQASRLFRILQAAGRFCPNIKNIELLGPLVEKKATVRQKQNCYLVLEMMKKAAPYAATLKLKQYIDGIEEIPET